MIEWNWIAQLAAFLVMVRMGCFVNGMHASRVPQRCALAVVAMGVGALGVLIGPLWGVTFEWPQAAFAVGSALFVWLDRRAPVCTSRSES